MQNRKIEHLEYEISLCLEKCSNGLKRFTFWSQISTLRRLLSDYLSLILLPEHCRDNLHIDVKGYVHLWNFTSSKSCLDSFRGIIKLDTDVSMLDYTKTTLNSIAIEVCNEFLHSIENIDSIPQKTLPGNRAVAIPVQDESFVKNPSRDSLMNAIKFVKSSCTLFVRGHSASGKTVMVSQVISKLMGDWSYTWLDLANVGTYEYDIFYSILCNFSETKKKHILVLDNAQAHPSMLRSIKGILEKLQNMYSTCIFVTIFVGWHSVDSIINQLYPRIRTFECDGNALNQKMVENSKFSMHATPILQNANGDAFIAFNTLKLFKQLGNAVNPNKLHEQIYQEYLGEYTYKLSSEAQTVLFHVAALGEFEIHAHKNYLAKISSKGLQELTNYSILRHYDSSSNERYYFVGHRSLSHVLVTYLRNILPEIADSPVDIAISYLKTEGDEQIYSTLERLDLEISRNEHILGNLWQAFMNVKTAFFKQMQNDLTWGNNIASMIFCADTLRGISFDSRSSSWWESISKLIRERWAPSPDYSSIQFIGEPTRFEWGITSEIRDFTEIKKRMLEEDLKFDVEPSMSAGSIDYLRFHNNWVLGLLLGFEGTALDFIDNELRSNYIKCAENMQLGDGSFYPQRVSWVTARVIMGLCECGLTYKDSIVRRACDWLIQQFNTQSHIIWDELSFMECGGWTSGTGTWNTNGQATLMCLSALLKAKYPISHSSDVQKVIDSIWKNRQKLREKRPEDVMWIIDTMVLAKKDLLQMKDEIGSLIQLINTKWDHAGKLADETNGESCEASFDALETMNLIWIILTDNIDTLLKGLKLDYSIYENKKRIFISYRRTEGGGSVFAQTIYYGLQKKYANDVFLDVVDLKRECDEFLPILEKAIENCSVFIVVLSDHVFDRCVAPDYNIEQDVLIREIRTALNNSKKVIAVYNGTTKDPDNLQIRSPEVYDIANSLRARNAVFYHSEAPIAPLNMISEIEDKIHTILTD